MSEFVRSKDLNTETVITTGVYPISRSADIEIKGEFDGVYVRTEIVSTDDILLAGVSIFFDDDSDLYAAVFCGQNHRTFRMSDGKWLPDDPQVQQLQETNRQLVAENERRSAEIASLKLRLGDVLLDG